MVRDSQTPLRRRSRATSHPWERALTTLRVVFLLIGAVALVLDYGVRGLADESDIDWLLVVCAGALSTIPLLEWRLSTTRDTFTAEQRVPLVASAVALAGWALHAMVLPPEWVGQEDRLDALEAWCGWVILFWQLWALVSIFTQVSYARWSAATVLSISFAGLVAVGTSLLMLPRSSADGTSASFTTALFTTTSAVCVTGLAVVDTGTYWSRTGHCVIMGLIQVGGLGIMTFGAFFTLTLRGGTVMRESALLGEMLEHQVINEVRRLVFAIFAFTFFCEALGAILICGLWSHLPLEEQAFNALFHAVSAFCNAGFAMTPDNMESVGTRPEVWGVIASLIIVGGGGFVVLYNLFEVGYDRFVRRRPSFLLLRARVERPRIQLTTRLVVWCSAILLVGGTAGIWLLELRRTAFAELPWYEKLAHSWFQSVSCRTAGFNTLPIAELGEPTLLLMIVLMFIGGSPGSTAGGVKTVAASVLFLSMVSMLRSRERLEVSGRTISDSTVRRSLLIAALAGGVVVFATLILVAVENRPGFFLNYLFEVVSALGTVGLTADVTPRLSEPGRLIVASLMFIGRIGPMTVLSAVAGQGNPVGYRYPEERVMLG